MKISKAKDIILSNDENSKLNLDFIKLYGKDSKVLEAQKQRYINALEKFSKLYPNRDEIEIYSASGRTEIGGNHTDHQHGCVLAAAVNLDVMGIVAFHNEKVIRVKSEGYDAFEVELSDLSVKKEKLGPLL
jgi:galactokinase